MEVGKKLGSRNGKVKEILVGPVSIKGVANPAVIGAFDLKDLVKCLVMRAIDSGNLRGKQNHAQLLAS